MVVLVVMMMMIMMRIMMMPMSSMCTRGVECLGSTLHLHLLEAQIDDDGEGRHPSDDGDAYER